MAEETFLAEVYRESGDQVRSISTMRNTFLSFYVIAMAAFIALLAQRDDQADKLIWAVPTVISLAGVVYVWATWKFIQSALRRQELIAKRLLHADVVNELNLIARPDYQTLSEALTTSGGPSNLRLEMILFAFYAAPLVTSIVFIVTGDPFGLTN